MRTDTVLIKVIDGEAVVVDAAPWLRPPVTVRYHYRHPSRWQQVRRSPFAGHLRAATRAAFWPSAICSGAIVGLLLVDLSRAVL